MAADDLLVKLGGCGRFQTLVYLVLSLIYMRGAWHVFAIIYLGDAGEYFCLSPLDKQTEQLQNQSSTELLTTEKCQVVHHFMNGSTNVSTATSCSSWSFKSEFEATIVTDWNLVCDQNFMVELSMTVYMVGTAIGALFLTAMADRFGRKTILLPCLILQTAIGVGVSFVNNIILFTTLRFFIGFLNMGISLTTYVLMTELFPASHRTQPSIAIQCFWAAGVMSLALFGYCVRNWRYLQLLITLPNILAIAALWFVPESLQWLLATNKPERAILVLKTVAKVNKLTLFQSDELTEENISSVQQLLYSQGNCVNSEMKHYTLNSDCNGDHKLKNKATQNVLIHPDKVGLEHLRTNANHHVNHVPIKTTDFEVSQIEGIKQQVLLRSEKNPDVNESVHENIDSNNINQNGSYVSMETADNEVFQINGIKRDFTSVENLDINKYVHEYIHSNTNRREQDGSLVAMEFKAVLRTFKDHESDDQVDGVEFELEKEETCEVTSRAATERCAFDLFRSPRMRLYTVIMFYLFLVNSLSYFGISLSTPILHGNPFLNLFLMGLVELPAYVICVFAIIWSGRRMLICAFLMMCAVTSSAAVFIPEHTDDGTSLLPLKISLVMLGKFAITGSYSTVYLFSAELFPTVVRNQAMGIASFFENLGSISAPFIVYAAKTHPKLPLLLFSILTLIGSIVVLLLPETQRKPLPETFEEVENWLTRDSKPNNESSS